MVVRLVLGKLNQYKILPMDGNLVDIRKRLVLKLSLSGLTGSPHSIYCRADSRFVPSQWETALLGKDISHWLDTNLESAPSLSSYWLIGWLVEVSLHDVNFVLFIFRIQLPPGADACDILGKIQFSLVTTCLTHLPLGKSAAICRRYFQMRFREWKILYFT